MIIYDPKITGSFQINGSTISSVGEIDNLSGSVAALNNASSSYLLNTTDVLNGNLTVTGTLTAQEFHTEYTSASIVYQSGSTKFGDTSDDVHQFTGSALVTGNVGIGLNSPSVKLDVNGSTKALKLIADDTTAQTGFNGNSLIQISRGAAPSYLQFISPNNQEQGILFGDPDDTVMGSVRYDHSGDFMWFQANNTERMRIDSSGRIGIGTANPSSTLHIKDDFSGGVAITLDRTENAVVDTLFYTGVSSNGSIGSDFMWLGASTTSGLVLRGDGLVGIGTAVPQSKLHLTGAITISDVGGTNDNILIQFTESNNYDQFAIKGDFAGAGVENKLKFTTDLGGGSILTLKGDGNIGISNSSPAALLHITNTAQTKYIDNFTDVLIEDEEARLQICSANTGNQGSSIILSNESKHWAFQNRGASANNTFSIGFIDTTDTTDLVGGAMNNTPLTLTTDGKVGIGTASPNETLQVDGNIRIGVAGNNLLFDTTGANSSNGIRTINDYETVIYNGRGSAGFAVIGNSNIRLGFGTLYTAAQSSLLIQSNGNVGIGNISPASKLDVTGVIRYGNNSTSIGSLSYGSGLITLESTSANTSIALLPTGTGNVGIGTTSPGQLLHLRSAGPARILLEADTDNVTETDTAGILFSQDGGLVTGRVGLSDTNHLELVTEYTGGQIFFGTANNTRMRIDANGTVHTNYGVNVVSEGLYRASFNTTAGVTTTLFDMSSHVTGYYLVSVTRVGGSTAERVIAIIGKTGTPAVFIYNVLDANAMTLSGSGANLQITTNSSRTITAAVQPLVLG